MSTANPMKSYRRYKGGRGKSSGGKLLRAVLVLILVAALVFGSLLAVVLVGSHDKVIGEPQVMIVLGCQVLPSGEPAPMLQDRLDEALDYLESHPDVVVIVSGGKGTDKVLSEARSMANYLMAHGVPEAQILLEDRATSTYENMVYSLELLSSEGYDPKDGILVVSSGFHLARARMLWNRVDDGNVEISTLAAPYSSLWMYIREPLVLAKDFLVRR